MGTSFEPVRALLRECLGYPGQSYETIRRVVGASAGSLIRNWLEGKTTPKCQRDWPVIERKLTEHRTELDRRGTNPEICDERWAAHFRSYCDREHVTPEAFAKRVGAPEWHGHRWHRWGEVPFDHVREVVVRRTGYDFDALRFQRGHEAAGQHFGRQLPAPLDAAVDAAALRQAILEIQRRSGLTREALAKRTGLRKSQLDGLARLPETRQKLYNAASIAGVIVGLARYIIAHHDQFSTSAIGATDATRQALELLTRRPPRPRGSTKGRTTVRWERIERELRKGTHRFLGYRCPNGEFAALVLVRFCIACERSRLTTRELCVRTGLRSHRLGSWLNGRVLPDFSMLEQLQNALERLEGRAADPTPASAESSAALVATRAAHRAPPEPAAPVPTDGAADILVGMASTARGLRAMYRAGWRPDGTSREHLIAVAQTAMEVGGLTHADLTSKATVSVADASAPAFRAVLDAFSPPRRGRRKGDRKEE